MSDRLGIYKSAHKSSFEEKCGFLQLCPPKKIGEGKLLTLEGLCNDAKAKAKAKA